MPTTPRINAATQYQLVDPAGVTVLTGTHYENFPFGFVVGAQTKSTDGDYWYTVDRIVPQSDRIVVHVH
jgi:hypothetical protein